MGKTDKDRTGVKNFDKKKVRRSMYYEEYRERKREKAYSNVLRGGNYQQLIDFEDS